MDTNQGFQNLFGIELGEELKNIAMQSNNHDHARLKALAQEVGINQGEVLHLLLNLIDISTIHADERRLIDESVSMPKLEKFLLLFALDAKLLTKREFDAVVTFASYGDARQSATRIKSILKTMMGNLVIPPDDAPDDEWTNS